MDSDEYDAAAYCGFGIPDRQTILREVVIVVRGHASLHFGEIVGVVAQDNFAMKVRRRNSTRDYSIMIYQTKPFERAVPQSGGLARWLGGDPRKGTDNGNRDR